MPKPRATSLDRYVLRQLLTALVATTGGLAALIWLTQSLHFVQLVVDRGLSLGTFLKLTGLLIPSFIAVILPITTFVVTQFVYGRLANDRELTVMRAAGLSSAALSRPAILCAVIAAASCTVLDIWVVPASYHEFRTFQFAIRNRMAAYLLQDGVFTQMSSQMTVYVRKRAPDGSLAGILVEDDRQPNARATILAERGRIVTDPSGTPDVMLYDGSRQEVDRQTGRLDVLTFSQNTISLTSTDKNADQQYRDSAEMTIPELLHPDPHTTLPRDRGKFAVEANRRLSAPFTALSFAAVALLAVLNGTFSRHGNIVRPLVAIGAIVGLLALGLLIQNLASRVPALMPLVWLHAILPGLVALGFLYAPEIAAPDPVAAPKKLRGAAA